MSLLKKISKDEARYLNEHGCRKFIKHTFGKSKKKTYYVVECLEVEKVLNEYHTKIVRIVYDSRNKGVKNFGNRK